MSTIKQKKAKYSNGQTKEQLMSRLPIPGPGRTPDTIEKKIEKKAVKKWLEEYEDGLAKELPGISTALILMAKSGNIPAISEIHKVLGAYKKTEGPATAIQINFSNDKEEFK